MKKEKMLCFHQSERKVKNGRVIRRRLEVKTLHVYSPKQHEKKEG